MWYCWGFQPRLHNSNTVFAIQNFFLGKSVISSERSPFSVFKNHSLVHKRENEWFLKIQKWNSSSRNQWFPEKEVLKRKSQTHLWVVNIHTLAVDADYRDRYVVVSCCWADSITKSWECAHVRRNFKYLFSTYQLLCQYRYSLFDLFFFSL